MEGNGQWLSWQSVSLARAIRQEKTHRQLSEILGIELTSAEIEIILKQAKRCEQDRKRLNGEDAKNQRMRTSLMRAAVMGKEAAKKTSYRRAQVPLGESAKSSVKKKSTTVRKCSICRQPGHTARQCTLPRSTKRLKNPIEWDVNVPTPKKPRKAIKLIEW